MTETFRYLTQSGGIRRTQRWMLQLMCRIGPLLLLKASCSSLLVWLQHDDDIEVPKICFTLGEKNYSGATQPMLKVSDFFFSMGLL